MLADKIVWDVRVASVDLYVPVLNVAFGEASQAVSQIHQRAISPCPEDSRPPLTRRYFSPCRQRTKSCSRIPSWKPFEMKLPAHKLRSKKGPKTHLAFHVTSFEQLSAIHSGAPTLAEKPWSGHCSLKACCTRTAVCVDLVSSPPTPQSEVHNLKPSAQLT
jgi:hypothetical protein